MLINCPLKPIPDSVTDTEQPTVTISIGKGWVTIPATPFNPKEPIYIIGCNGNISVGSEPEPTNADILAAIQDLKECIRKIQQGERIS